MVLSESNETWNLQCLHVAGKSCEAVQQIEPDAGVIKISYTAEQDIKMAYKKYYKSCCRYAADMIRDEQAAEDIVADAFLRLLQKADSVNSAGMESELYAIVDRKCNDHVNKRKLLAAGVSAFDVITPSGEDEIEAELNVLIHDELRKLPPQRKLIMLQLYMEGLSSQEVAQRMQLSRQTVINQKGKAIKALRNNIVRRLFQRK
jgi:RNA polymerase sigma factor (sigma-70 family)